MSPGSIGEQRSRRGQARATVLGGLILLLVVWRTLGALSALGQEPLAMDRLHDALTFSTQERMQRALRILEDESGFGRGELTTLHAAMDSVVGAENMIWVIRPKTGRQRMAATRLGPLAFPTQFDQFLELPPNGPPHPESVNRNLFVLEFERHPTEQLEPWFELLAEEPGFRFWQGRESAR